MTRRVGIGWCGTLALAFAATARRADAWVDLNRIAEDDLARMPFVGDIFAAAIVEERAARGPFRDEDDLRTRVPGVTAEIWDRWRRALHVVPAGPRTSFTLDAAIVQQSAGAWSTTRTRIRYDEPVRPHSVLSIDLRRTATRTSGVIVWRTPAWSVTTETAATARAAVRIVEAGSTAALLRAALMRAPGMRAVVEARAGSAHGALVWYDAAGESSDSSEDLAPGALDSADVEPAVPMRPRAAAGIGWGSPQGMRSAVAVTLARDGHVRVTPAFQARNARPAADLDLAAWWDDAPRVHARAASGDPRAGLRWGASIESALLRSAASGANRRLARLALDVHAAAGDSWEGVATVSDELRAPAASALRPSARLVGALEIARIADRSVDEPWNARVEIRSTRHADVASATPRVQATLRGQLHARGPAVAVVLSCGAGTAWCAGWRVARAAGPRRIAVLHAIAHGAVRRTTAPAWPLGSTGTPLRGDGLDLMAEVREGGHETGVAVGRATAPQEGPRWWCRVRLGWPRRA